MNRVYRGFVFLLWCALSAALGSQAVGPGRAPISINASRPARVLRHARSEPRSLNSGRRLNTGGGRNFTDQDPGAGVPAAPRPSTINVTITPADIRPATHHLVAPDRRPRAVAVVLDESTSTQASRLSLNGAIVPRGCAARPLHLLRRGVSERAVHVIYDVTGYFRTLTRRFSYPIPDSAERRGGGQPPPFRFGPGVRNFIRLDDSPGVRRPERALPRAVKDEEHRAPSDPGRGGSSRACSGCSLLSGRP